MDIYTEHTALSAAEQIICLIKKNATNLNEVQNLRLGFNLIGEIVVGDEVVYPIIGEWNNLSDEIKCPFYTSEWIGDEERSILAHIEEGYTEERTGFQEYNLFYGFSPIYIGGDTSEPIVTLPRLGAAPITFNGTKIITLHLNNKELEVYKVNDKYVLYIYGKTSVEATEVCYSLYEAIVMVEGREDVETSQKLAVEIVKSCPF